MASYSTREFFANSLKFAVSIPAYLAFHWAQLPFKARVSDRRHESSLRNGLKIPYLLPHESEIATGLDRDGVFTSDIAMLGLDSLLHYDIIAAGRSLAQEVVEKAAAKGALGTMTTATPMDLLRYPALYCWGLNAVLLRIAESYLRSAVGYDGVQLHHSPADGLQVGTRRWHLDREDTRMIKIMLYLNDVDEAGGPFQILKSETHRDDGRWSYPVMTDAKRHARMGSQPLTTCIGKAGTMVFADTARFFHRAKPAIEVPRSVIIFSYFSRTPRHPYFCGRSQLSRRQIKILIEGLHPVQRASALWRDELPWSSRIIPVSKR